MKENFIWCYFSSLLCKKASLHNDIKSNNVVIDKKDTEINGILIDLGKGCFSKDATGYHHLSSNAERRKHVKTYPSTRSYQWPVKKVNILLDE